MDLAALLIPPSLDAKQALRLRRFGLAALTYAVAAVLVALAWTFGLLPASAALGAAAAFVAINLGLYLAVRSGFNLRFDDPSLTRFQILAAITVVMYIIYQMDDGRNIVLFSCFIVFLFGIFRFNAREFTVATLYTLAAYALVINLLMHFRPQAIHDVPHELLSWLALAVFLPYFTIIGGHINTLRRKLRDSEVREYERRESELRFRSLTEMSSDFYWESDAGHRLTMRSSAAKASSVSMFQQGAQVGQLRWEIPSLSPDVAGWQAHRAVLDAHQPFRNFELSRRGTDGTERHISISGDPVFNESGAFTGYRGVGTDITARKRAEQALQKELRRHRALMDTAIDGIHIVDQNGRLVEANPAFLRMIGYGKDEAIGLHIADWDVHSNSEETRARIASLATHSEILETKWRRKDGSIRDINLSISALEIEGVVCYYCAARDITERKEAEKDLRASELRFRQMAENIRDVFFLRDADGKRFLYVSPAYEEIWGRSRESLYANAESWTEAIHPDDRASAYGKSQEGAAAGEKYEYGYRIVRPDGSIRWIESRGFPVRDDAGKLVRIAGVVTDVTERKQAMQVLRESERRFSTLLGNVELVSMMRDREGRITYCNEYLLRLTGWRQEDVIGRDWIEQFIPPEIANEKKDVFAALIANRPEAWHYEHEILTRSGERRLIHWNNSVLRSGSGDVIGTASIGEDMTEQKRAESALRESENRYRDLVENSAGLICTHDLEGKLLSVNAAIVQFTGYSRDALLRMNVADLLTQGARDGFAAYLAEIRAKGAARGLMQIRTANGTTRWWEYHNTLRTEGVAAPVVRGIGEDVTERKTAQDALRASEVQLKAILESTGEGILAVDRKGKVIQANRRFAEQWRISKPLLDSKDKQALLDFCASQMNDAEAFVNKVHGLYASDVEDMDTLTCKDGRVFESHSTPLILAGAFVGRVWSFRDTTERKHMEERLQKLSHAVEQSPSATAITDTHGRFEYVNPKFVEVTGYTQEELIGETPALIKSGFTLPDVYENLWRTILSGTEWRGEIQNRRKNGELYWEYEIISPLKNERGEIVNFIAVKEDITERKAREEDLQRFRMAMDATEDGIYLVDRASLRFVDINSAACNMLGLTREEILAAGPEGVLSMSREDLARIYDAVIAGITTTEPIEMLRQRKSGKESWIEIRRHAQRTAEGWMIVTVARDINKRKLAEAALQQEHANLLETQQQLINAHESLAKADRLESVGRLAAGVAHEVKNPLTIIRLGTDYLAKQFPQESSQEVLDDVRAAIDRAEHVIRDLLEFSRQKPVARRPTYINEVIDDALRLIKHEMETRNIAIVRNRDDPVPPISADPERLVQVFINLLANAAQAIGRNGSIEIVERSTRLGEQDLARSEKGVFRIGEPVITVDIRDSGPGISPESENRLFEPFFTTKPQGEGSGLGLAVARNIVIMHGGSISISNRPEGGASALLMFRVAGEHLTNEKANTGSR